MRRLDRLLNRQQINDLLPWRAGIDPVFTPVAHSGWDSPVADSATAYCMHVSSNGTSGDYRDDPCVLGAGTWTIETTADTANLCGIITFKLDGTSVGTVDYYTVPNNHNIRLSATGISVAAMGKVVLRLATPTKNASSSGYNQYLNHIELFRTA